MTKKQIEGGNGFKEQQEEIQAYILDDNGNNTEQKHLYTYQLY